MAPVNVFVAARGNEFMADIAAWIAEAAVLAGRESHVVRDGLPEADGCANLVVAPHEFFELHAAPRRQLQLAAAASVCICTEQPGTRWFDLTVDAARMGLVAFDINAHGVRALRQRGINAHRLQLGAVPSMIDEKAAAGGGRRNIDVLFMGGLDDRRGAVLADLAPHLVSRHVDLRLFKFDRPIGGGAPGLVFGDAKYQLLAGSRILLNVHRRAGGGTGGGAAGGSGGGVRGEAYFEWARMVEAMANGCVVITEPSTDAAPLQAGVHFVEADTADLGEAIEALLADDERSARIASAAFDAVTGQLALQRSVGAMLDQIEREVLGDVVGHVARGVSRTTRWRLGASQVPPPVRLAAFKPHLRFQRRAKAIAMAESAALRRLDAANCLLRHGTGQHLERVETPAYAEARPEVSVTVSLYNYEEVVTETLDSIVASEAVQFEVIVIDDHATDRSRDVVRRFLAGHPEVPMLLVGKDANEGLAAARNTAFELARAELVMVVDADNLLYRTCLRKLADRLHHEPDADAAYGVLEDFGEQRNLRSALAWDVQRLCRANYIDAQAMIRRSAWERLGGYRDDDDVYGWEDWDLWLRLAADGGHASLVTEILGRYRVQQGSMIALTNLGSDDALAAIRSRYPTLPWPPAPGQ